MFVFQRQNSPGARFTEFSQKEVEVYWKALVADRGHRVPAAQNKPGPYSYHDFHLEAIEVAVRLATENASEETAPLLQSGPDDKGDSYWVARWCLYHLCRNRDGRNGRPNTGSRTQTAGGHSDLAAA